jgi:hypothetical protein
MPLENGKEKIVHLVKLDPYCSEYQKVLKMFQSSNDPSFPEYFMMLRQRMSHEHSQRISIEIERIQNPHLYQQYMAHKQKMDKDNGGMNNERRLFHGTESTNVNAINTQGFNRSFCGANGKLVRSILFLL